MPPRGREPQPCLRQPAASRWLSVRRSSRETCDSHLSLAAGLHPLNAPATLRDPGRGFKQDEPTLCSASAVAGNACLSSWRVCRGDEGCCCAGIGGRVRVVRAGARQPGTARALRGITVRVRGVDQAASRPGLWPGTRFYSTVPLTASPAAQPRSITANPRPMKTDRNPRCLPRLLTQPRSKTALRAG